MKINVINTPVVDFTTVNVEERKDLKIRAGDTVKVSVKIQEKNSKGKERVRIQIFEGLVLSRKHGSEAGATICVRKVSKGIGVERIFPIFSPIIDKIEIVKRGGVRKSKLYYLREKVAKEIRRQMRRASLVNVATTSDIEETEKKIKEAEEAQAAEEAAASETAAKDKEIADAKAVEEAEEISEEVAEEVVEKVEEKMANVEKTEAETEVKAESAEIVEEVSEEKPEEEKKA
jgi:large subunit ribosomal protein L19